MILQGRNLTQGLSGADVAALHKELTQLGFTVLQTEQQASSFGAGTLAAVEQSQAAQKLSATGIVDNATAGAFSVVMRNSTYVVTGTDASAGGLLVELVDKYVGGDVALAETTTARGAAI